MICIYTRAPHTRKCVRKIRHTHNYVCRSSLRPSPSVPLVCARSTLDSVCTATATMAETMTTRRRCIRILSTKIISLPKTTMFTHTHRHRRARNSHTSHTHTSTHASKHAQTLAHTSAHEMRVLSVRTHRRLKYAHSCLAHLELALALALAHTHTHTDMRSAQRALTTQNFSLSNFKWPLKFRKR